MSRGFTTSTKNVLAAASAVAISSAGLVVFPPAAQAIDCVQWGFPGDVNIMEQGTGWSVSFSATGTSANVPATARNANGEVRNGTLSGNIFADDSFDVTVRYPQGTQRYQGKVRADGTAAGQTTQVPHQGKLWVTQFPLSCVKLPDPVAAPAAPPSRAPEPAAPASPIATVTGDVDIYDGPGGEGNVIGILRAGQTVRTAGRCSTNTWCEIPGTGWVWGEFIQYQSPAAPGG